MSWKTILGSAGVSELHCLLIIASTMPSSPRLIYIRSLLINILRRDQDLNGSRAEELSGGKWKRKSILILIHFIPNIISYFLAY
jgi:hypothetical protein